MREQMRADGALRCEVARHTLSKLTLARRSKLSLAVSSSCQYPHAKMLDHVLAVQFFVLPRSVVRHVAPSIDGYILETPARKRCEERRTTGHATSRRRRH